MEAVVLDWNTTSWAAGANSQLLDIDVAHPGNDISMLFSGAVSKFRNDPITGKATPVTDQQITGGPATITTLDLGVDFHQNNNITLTVLFTTGYIAANNVTFSIFGIDKNGSTYQDQIAAISAIGIDGITLVAPTITNVGSSVTLTGSGLNQLLTGNALVPQTGPGSDAGNATISFGATPILSFTITYQDGIGARNNPTFQNIAIGNISFAPVPEVDGAIYAGASALVAIAAIVKRRFKRLETRLSA